MIELNTSCFWWIAALTPTLRCVILSRITPSPQHETTIFPGHLTLDFPTHSPPAHYLHVFKFIFAYFSIENTMTSLLEQN
jgi:hypothetical protein